MHQPSEQLSLFTFEADDTAPITIPCNNPLAGGQACIEDPQINLRLLLRKPVPRSDAGHSLAQAFVY
jgi:hypothetical protein